MKKIIRYKVRNWREYNQSLVNRGNLTLWFSDDALQSWYSERPLKQKQGRPFLYSDRCIEAALTVRAVFHFSLRATQGFLQGLATLMGLHELDIPHYSSLSKRAKDLKINISHKANTRGITDIAVDSTGLKIYGEGDLTPLSKMS